MPFDDNDDNTEAALRAKLDRRALSLLLKLFTYPIPFR